MSVENDPTTPATSASPTLPSETTGSIPLPPPPEPSSAAELAAELSRLDRVLVVMTVVFAFLCTSFTARNSDFWMHLATGRLVAQGEYTIGVDPFAYTTTGQYWANHAWLYD